MKINILPFSKILSDSTKKFTKIKKQDYLECGKYTIVDQGKNFICGYTNEEELVNFEDIPLIVFGDHTKVFKYIDFPIAIGADGVKVLTVDSHIADAKYIYYYLKSLKLHDAGYSRHFKYLKAKKIVLPESKNDQIKIANLLTQVETLIAKREESIELLDELLKSTFLDMFGGFKDLDYRLEELCSEIVDCPHSTPKYSDSKTEFECLRTSEFSKGQIDYSSMKYVNEEEYLKRVKRLVPKFGDVLYAREGSYGDAVRIPKKSLICLGQRTMLFRPKIEICNSIFLWALVRSNMVFRQAKKKNKGATVGRVNVKDIKNFKVFLPPKPLQDKFATIVQQAEATKAHYQDSLDELNELFGSISQRAFKGELDLSGIPIVHIADTKALNVPSSSGASGIVIEQQKVKTIKGHAKSGAVDVQKTLEVSTFMRKQMDDEEMTTATYTDSSNNPVYSEDFLWMILQQSDDEISFETINKKLEKFSFREYPNYDQVQEDIFSLILQNKLSQHFDKNAEKIVLSRVL